jgi:Flp pilus assembly protein TadD
VQRAVAYFFKKQPEQALADANEAIRLDPRHLMAYKLRGGVLGGMGRRDEAIADFRKALELDPSDESVKKNLKDLGVTP